MKKKQAHQPASFRLNISFLKLTNFSKVKSHLDLSKKFQLIAMGKRIPSGKFPETENAYNKGHLRFS